MRIWVWNVGKVWFLGREAEVQDGSGAWETGGEITSTSVIFL
jgi:hypothetical protein